MKNSKIKNRNSKQINRINNQNTKRFGYFNFLNLNIITDFGFRVTNFTSKGFTLIELLIYMGILSIFMSVLAGLFGTTIDLQLEANANTSLDREAQFLFSRISYDLHRAESIDIPLITGSPDSILTLSIGGIDYTYSIDGNENLSYENDTGTHILNSFDSIVTDLSFIKIGNTGGIEDTVKVSFTLSSVYSQRKGIETRSFETTIGLRR